MRSSGVYSGQASRNGHGAVRQQPFRCFIWRLKGRLKAERGIRNYIARLLYNRKSLVVSKRNQSRWGMPLQTIPSWTYIWPCSALQWVVAPAA